MGALKEKVSQNETKSIRLTFIIISLVVSEDL